MTNNFNLRRFLKENKITRNSKLLKEETEYNRGPFDTEEEAREAARIESMEGYSVHVDYSEENDSYYLDDWYDSDTTVVSYMNGSIL